MALINKSRNMNLKNKFKIALVVLLGLLAIASLYYNILGNVSNTGKISEIKYRPVKTDTVRIIHDTDYHTMIKLHMFGGGKFKAGECTQVGTNIYVTADTIIIAATGKDSSVFLTGKPIEITNSQATLVCSEADGNKFSVTKVSARRDSLGHIERFVVIYNLRNNSLFALSEINSCEKASRILKKELN